MRLDRRWIMLCVLVPALAGCPKLKGELELPPEAPAEDEPADADDPADEELCGHGAWMEFTPAHDGVSAHVEGEWWSSDLGWGTLVAVQTPLPDAPGIAEVIGVWHFADGTRGGDLYAHTSEFDERIVGSFWGPEGEPDGRLDGWFGGDVADTTWAVKVGEFAAELIVDPYGGGEVHGEWLLGPDSGELHGGLGVEGPDFGWAVAELFIAPDTPIAFQEGGWEILDDSGRGWYGGRWVAPADDIVMEGGFEAEWVMLAPDFGVTFGSYFAPTCFVPEEVE